MTAADDTAVPNGHDRNRVLAEAMAAAQQRAADLANRPELLVFEEPLPLIPPGQYQAVGLGWRFTRYRRFGPAAAKLSVEWAVLVPDPEAEFGTRKVTLCRHYNVLALGPGRYRATRTGGLTREWSIVTGRRPRRDRPAANAFVGVACM